MEWQKHSGASLKVFFRKKVNISLSLFNTEDKPINGNFSVAVVEDKRTAKEEDETSILSNLLLTSDLKGYVEKPNYYFTNSTAQTSTHLELLMLTQGYRRFEWKKVLDVFHLWTYICSHEGTSKTNRS